MARLTPAPESRAQFGALARLQWQAFFNALRTTRGRLELGSRILTAAFFAAFGAGGCVALGAAAWYFVRGGRPDDLALLLWLVFAFWQLFPLIATTFSESFDWSHFLRFPLDFRSYLLVRVAYGLFDPVAAVGGLWLLGIALGTGIGRPALFPWALLVLLLFAAFNILLTRMIFAWTERWLAQRRTREILSALLILCLLGFQFIGPVARRLGHASTAPFGRLEATVAQGQRFLPPGLAAEAMARAALGHAPAALAYAAGLCACLAAVGWLLGLRLRAEYRGENLSESAAKIAPQAARAAPRPRRPSWGLPGPVGAVVEKELLGLTRSPALLFILLMPLVLLLLFLVGPGRQADDHAQAFLAHRPDLAFPVGTAYALLLLTSLSHNFLGGEGSGVQLFFASPVSFRRIALGKNLAHTAVIGLQMIAIWIAVCLMYRPPAPAVTVATVAGLLFALPLEFSAGNLLSVYFPKRVDYAKFGRQRASRVTVLAGLAFNLALFGIAALTAFLATVYGNLWAAVPVFLFLAAPALAAYLFVLTRIDGITLDRRETLISELSRTGAA